MPSIVVSEPLKRGPRKETLVGSSFVTSQGGYCAKGEGSHPCWRGRCPTPQRCRVILQTWPKSVERGKRVGTSLNQACSLQGLAGVQRLSQPSPRRRAFMSISIRLGKPPCASGDRGGVTERTRTVWHGRQTGIRTPCRLTWITHGAIVIISA